MNHLVEQPGRTARASLAMCLSLLGAVLLSPAVAGAQQNGAPPAVGATARDSALCAAAESYLVQHPTEVQRMEREAFRLLQAPETQRMFQTALQQSQQAGRGKPGEIEIQNLDMAKLTDSIRIPFAAAIAKGEFDSARVLGMKALGGDSTKALARAFAIDLPLKLLGIVPDTLRSLVATGLARGSAVDCVMPMGAVQLGSPTSP